MANPGVSLFLFLEEETAMAIKRRLYEWKEERRSNRLIGRD